MQLVPRSNPALLSFVIPLYNEEEMFPELRARMEKVTRSFPCAVEIVLVNDGSRDNTARQALEWAHEDRSIKVLDFARNFGHQIAVTAGLDHASGQAMVIMDGDLQDPPELALEMLEKYRMGYDVVYGKRIRSEGISFLKRVMASGFYWAMRSFIYKDLPSDAGDFRLISRAVTDTMGQIRESRRFLRGMITWVGFPQTFVEFERPGRAAGESKYPLRKQAKFAWDGVLCFSTAPLRMGFYLGGALIMIAVIWGANLTANYFVQSLLPSPYAFFVVFQCLVSGFTLVCLGFLGEYVGRVFEESKHRPLYIVRRTANVLASPQNSRAVVHLQLPSAARKPSLAKRTK